MNRVFLILFTLLSSELFAAYYDTLPVGRRTVVYRRVQTDEINSEFTSLGQKANYDFNVNINAEAFASIDGVADFLETFKDISPSAYERFTLGKYEIKGKAQVHVDGFGFGYGLTNRHTVYGSLPIYNARVNIDMNRTGGNTKSETLEILNNTNSGNAYQGTIENLISQAPDVTGGLIQAVLTGDLYGYKPLGDWEARGLGDVELGVITRLTDWQDAGLAVTPGIVLPTGRIDDPDMLQDFAFGDGQADVFLEFGGGMSFPKLKTSFEAWARYTYQLPTTKTLRAPNDPEFTLSDRTLEFDEKLGNQIDFTYQQYYHASSYVDLFAGYLYRQRGQSKYESSDPIANEILQMNTNEIRHTMRLGGSVSTIDAYFRGRFAAPMLFTISAEKIFAGENTPNYTRFDIEARLYF